MHATLFIANRTMNFFPQFNRTAKSHLVRQEAEVKVSELPEGVLVERSEVCDQPPAFAYIATTDAPVELSHNPKVSIDDRREEGLEPQPVHDDFLGELFGLLFLVAFSGSVFMLKHVYVLGLTLLSYLDRDVEKKYIKGAGG